MSESKKKEIRRKKREAFLKSLWPRSYKAVVGFVLGCALFWLWPFCFAWDSFNQNEWPWEC